MENRIKILFLVPPFYGHINHALWMAEKLSIDGCDVGFILQKKHAGNLQHIPLTLFIDEKNLLEISKDHITRLLLDTDSIYTASRKYQQEINELLTTVLISFNADVILVEAIIAQFISSLPILKNRSVGLFHSMISSKPNLQTGPENYGGFPATNLIERYGIFKGWMKYKIKFIKKDIQSFGLLFYLKYLCNPPIKSWLVFHAFPKEIDYNIKRPSNHFYIGGQISLTNMYKRYETEVNKSILDQHPIFISLGTALRDEGERNKSTLCSFIQAIREMQDIQFIIAAGELYPVLTSMCLSGNIHLFDFVNQHQVLAYTPLIITHAGCNTVRDSLFYGVPMLCCPLGYGDQYGVSWRIRYHGLGDIIDYRNLDNSTIIRSIRQILSNSLIRKNCNKMKQLFKENEQNNIYGTILLTQIKKMIL